MPSVSPTLEDDAEETPDAESDADGPDDGDERDDSARSLDDIIDAYAG